MQTTSIQQQTPNPATLISCAQAESEPQAIRTLSMEELAAVSGGLMMPDQQVETLPVTRW